MSTDVINFEYRGRAESRQAVSLPVDASSEVIRIGSPITITGAEAGFVQRVDGNSDTVIGIAMTEVLDAGAADGDKQVLVDVSPLSIYEVRPSTGSVAAANLQSKFDAAANGATVLFGVTSTDGSILCVGVDTTRNTLKVRIDPVFTAYAP